MAKGKTSSASQKAQYTAYKTENRALKNKAARLARHQKNHPNDSVAQGATASGHTRKTPLDKGGWLKRQLSSVAGYLNVPPQDVPYGPFLQQRIAKAKSHFTGTVNQMAYMKKGK